MTIDELWLTAMTKTYKVMDREDEFEKTDIKLDYQRVSLK